MKKNIAIILVAIILGTIANAYFWSHYYFQSPIKRLEWQCLLCKGVVVPLPTQKPLQSPPTSKKQVIKESFSTDVVSQQLDMTDKEIAEYIKSKGWDYSIAIRLAKSENFWNLTHSFNCSRTHTNNDGSVDVGIFQINSIHTRNLAKLGMTMEDMKDCRKNINYAYNIWKDQGGFQAWSAFTNESYKNHDESI